MEVPLVLGIVLLFVVFAVVRWRGRRSDEWRRESAAPPAHDAANEQRTERP